MNGEDPLDFTTVDLSFQDTGDPLSLADILRDPSVNADATPADNELGALDQIYDSGAVGVSTSDVVRDRAIGVASPPFVAQPMDIGGFFAQLGQAIKTGGDVAGGVWSLITGQKTAAVGKQTAGQATFQKFLPILLIAGVAVLAVKASR